MTGSPGLRSPAERRFGGPAARRAIGWIVASISGSAMVLNSSLFNLGAAAKAGLGRFLLATGGFDAVAIGLPLVGLVSAALVWPARREPVAA